MNLSVAYAIISLTCSNVLSVCVVMHAISGAVAAATKLAQTMCCM